MSVQFGKCNLDDTPVAPRDFDRVRPLLMPYGTDAEGYYCKRNLGVLYRAFHTTKESRREVQPYVCSSGAVLMWDGRLDNREDLIGRLEGDLSAAASDLEIVAAAYERWGMNVFAQLVGDWAVSVWNPQTRSLFLAKDFVGARHLYYSVGRNQVTWSTILSPLVLVVGQKLMLDEEYVAGWLISIPRPHLSPYLGIRSVPASCVVHITPETQKVHKYWDFDSNKAIHYRRDAEYEEHFRAVFEQSVRRRLRSECPVVAELSGGMDSSSIVCVADQLLSRGVAETPRLDTVSYYDDCEPNWNERPYLTQVEESRGKKGSHIELRWLDPCAFSSDTKRFLPTPADHGPLTEADRQFAQCLVSQGNRVVLSGIGGDEVLGGVPTPIPELADLLARVQLRQFVQTLKLWALDKRKPWLYLMFATIREFVSPLLVKRPRKSRLPPWVIGSFVQRHWNALFEREPSLNFFGRLPSFQDSLSTLDGLRRQLQHAPLPCEPTYEKRYPYLDRDLLEFLYAIPRGQLVRPGQRRSLMRRSLVGIVPEAVLQRKRKAYASRGPLVALAANWPGLSAMTNKMLSEAMGIVDAAALLEAARDPCRGQEVPVASIIRTVCIEFWLRSLSRHAAANQMLVTWPSGSRLGKSASRGADFQLADANLNEGR